jgi:hypothetical protein
MIKQKAYITALLLLIGIYVFAKSKKRKGIIFVGDTFKLKVFSKVGTTVYDNDLTTPIYTFRNSIEVFIIQEDKVLENTKITFTANNEVKTGWIGAQNLIYK